MTLMYRVDGATATALPAVSLAEAGLGERGHLQEWVLANPAVLGDDVLVVTSEYDQWTGSDGVRTRDRLDILGLDTAGRLVVVELKRDTAPTDVHLQALTYAAMVSGFTLDTLADAHAAWLTRRGRPTDAEAARVLLLEHAGELDAELLRKPRIMLIASGFPRQVTNTAVWLYQYEVVIELVQVSAWRSADGILAGFNRLWPTPGAEEFTLSPTRADAERVSRKAAQRSRAATAVRRLIDAGALADGTRLRLVPQAGATVAQRTMIYEWVHEQPAREFASWCNDPNGPLRWEADGTTWLPTSLVRHILGEVTGSAPDAVRGTTWWVDGDGRTLADLAEGVPGQARRDWSDLHAVLDALPAGRWTTYGEIAQVIGTAAQPLGQHITGCSSCRHPWRVLNANGKVAEGFTWTDPARTETPQQILDDEGVLFTNGIADPAARLDAADLAKLLRDHT